MLKQLAKSLLFLLMVLSTISAKSQGSIFDEPHLVRLIKSAADQIYSLERDSAIYYVDEVRKLVPDHPIVPMMEAVSVLWYHIPVLQGDVFEAFNDRLNATVAAAENLPGDHPDAIFFEMSARGLLAEYYADRGAYMKAFNEATQAYGLLKDGFEFADDYPEFLFAVGLYNYFREAYPERHPIYKPLIWFFKGGDKEKGLAQLKRATQETVIIRVEAFVYLSYIYLRYEEKPELSHKYISDLYQEFPTNPYVQAKYLESYHAGKKIDKLKPEIIKDLKEHPSLYYQVVGNLYGGIVSEQLEKNHNQAFNEYQLALKISKELPGYADYYKSLIHLGLGRIYKQEGRDAQANMEFQQVIIHAQTEEVIQEANQWMNQ